MALRGVMTGGGDGSATGTPATVVLTLPAGCVAGDVALACVDGSTGTNTVTTPSDGGTAWTILSGAGTGGPGAGLGPDTSGTSQRAYVYGRTLASGDISAGVVTLTWSGGTRTVSAGIVLSGDTLTGIVVGTPLVQASNTSITMPSITTTVANSDVIFIIANRIGAGTPSSMTWPGTYTGDKDAKQASAGVNMEVSIAHLTTPGAAGSYGGNSVSWTGSQGPTIGYTIGIAAAASLTSVTSTRATTWATKGAVASTRATTWATRASVAATRATSWTTLASVAATRATTWKTLASILATRATTWAALASTASTRATTWATRAAVLATRATTWAVSASVTSTRATTWGVGGKVTDTKATTWNVLTSTAATRATSWTVLGSATSSRATAWATRSAITATKLTRWNTLASVASVRSTSWNVFQPPRDIQLAVVLDPPRYKATANTTSRFSALAAGSRFKSIGEEML